MNHATGSEMTWRYNVAGRVATTILLSSDIETMNDENDTRADALVARCSGVSCSLPDSLRQWRIKSTSASSGAGYLGISPHSEQRRGRPAPTSMLLTPHCGHVQFPCGHATDLAANSIASIRRRQ